MEEWTTIALASTLPSDGNSGSLGPPSEQMVSIPGGTFLMYSNDSYLRSVRPVAAAVRCRRIRVPDRCGVAHAIRGAERISVITLHVNGLISCASGP